MVALRRRVRALVLTTGIATLLAPAAAAQAHGMRATVTLRPRHARELAAYAAAVSVPGSADYHRYLSAAGFTRRFAPTAAQRHRVADELRAHGLTPTATSPDDLSITVRTAPRALGADALAPRAVSATRLRLGPEVQAIVGVHAAAPSASVIFGSHGALDGPDVLAHTATTPTGAGPQACAAAQSQATSQGALTPAQIAARYGLQNLYAAGDEGRGITVGVYELEPFNASDIAAYQACMGTSATVETEMVDGGAGTGAGSGEAVTDIEDIIGLVPDATIRVYEGPQSGSGPYATYAAMVSDDAAKVISTSWGLCEAKLGSASAQAENTLFAKAAVQGQTVLAASGDSGANDCANGTRAVDDPASQPYVTAVGATSAHGIADTVWDNTLGATGGGASTLWTRPAWQTSALAQTAVTCGTSGNACREVPDVSADGDPMSGYVIYYKGAWRTVGGTSAAAPTVASLAALADAEPSCAGHPVGFLNPALYADAADFTDVTSGSNSFGGVLGYSAGAGYDMASGLGTPTTALGPALCHDQLTLATPAAQSWTIGLPVSLTPSATSSQGVSITWSATGLPAGVSIAAAGGRITGTPTTVGRFAVTLTVLDADGAQQTTSFPVTVGSAPTPVTTPVSIGRPIVGNPLTGARRSTVAVQRLHSIAARVGRTLRVRLRTRVHLAGAGKVRWRARGLPRGLRIEPRSGLIMGTPRTAGRRTVRIDVSRASGVAATASVRVIVSARAPKARTVVRHRQGARRRRR
jgi:subtilase family serine protease